MAVYMTYSMLKDRWRILLKQIDMLLHHVGNIGLAHICLHNLSIIHGDKYNKICSKKVEFERVEASRQEFTNPLYKANTFCIATKSIMQMVYKMNQLKKFKRRRRRLRNCWTMLPISMR
jgi:cobalamin biosynthesis Co2+ chelatase CbiK